MGELVALVYSAGADPRHREELPPGGAHQVRDEIPLIEEALLKTGREVLSLPVGEAFLETARELALRSPSVVINLCEDLLGDSAHEMNFTALLDLLGLPYTGSSPFSLGLCRDKGKTKSILRHYGIPTPDFFVTASGNVQPGNLSFPLIVKPATEDGSLGIDDRCVVGDEESLRRRVRSLLGRYRDVIVEEYVAGRELNVALLGTSPETVLPVSEIDFSALPEGLPAICGYEAKWKEDDPRYRGTAPVCPAPLDKAQLMKIEVLSTSIYRILDLRDYGRIDWRLCPGRGLQFLEANPNPDISPASGFMRSLRASGRDYPEFLEILLAAARRRAPGERAQVT